MIGNIEKRETFILGNLVSHVSLLIIQLDVSSGITDTSAMVVSIMKNIDLRLNYFNEEILWMNIFR